MKKFLLIFLMLLSFNAMANAQVQSYRTTKFAYASVYNGRYAWGDWEYNKTS